MSMYYGTSVLAPLHLRDRIAGPQPISQPKDPKSQQSQRTSTRGLLAATRVVGAMTMVSRVLGLVRDVVFARLFGAGWLMDAFIIANRMPNMLRRFFAEGAFAQAFVPVLNEVREEGGDPAVRRLTANVAGTLGAIVFAITVIGVLAAPLLVAGFAPGFLADEKTFELTTVMLRFTFPYLLFVSLTSLASSVLNTYGRFAIPALTPVLLNVLLIGAALYLSPMFERPTLALAIAVFAGGFVQLGFQLPSVWRLKLLSRPTWGWRDSSVRKIMALMLPAIIGSSAVQINLVIDNMLASLLGEGRPAWLYNSDRLMEFPLGVFGIALATVILPSLSRSFTGKNDAEFSATLDWALRLVVLIALPATIGLALLAGPLVTTLFFGGAYTETDVLMTRASLWAFSGGLLAFIGIKILAPGYFARQDTKTPVKIGMVALLVNLCLNLSFVWLLMRANVAATHAGLAAATTCAAFVNAALLFAGLRRRGLIRGLPGWGVFLLRALLANAALVVFLWQVAPSLQWWLHADVWARIRQLMVLVGGGVGVYVCLLFVGGLRPKHLRMAN